MKTRLVIFGLPIFVATVSIMLWLAPSYRERSRLTRSKRNLSQIHLGLTKYHDVYRCFPPAYVRGPDGEPWHSWRTLLLPYVGEQALYSQYDFDEPWNGPHNSSLLRQRPAIYHSPQAANSNRDASQYLAIVSRRTMWPAYFSARLEDVKDGTVNTGQILEDITSTVPWLAPEDMDERSAYAVLSWQKTMDAKVQTAKANERTILLLTVSGQIRPLRKDLKEAYSKYIYPWFTPRYTDVIVDNSEWPPPLLVAEPECKSEFGVPFRAVEMKTTDVLLLPTAPIHRVRNSVYCAGVQVALNTLLREKRMVNRQSGVPALLTAVEEKGLSILNPQGREFLVQFDIPSADDDAPDRRQIQDRQSALQMKCSLSLDLVLVERMPQFDAPLGFRSAEGIDEVQSFGWKPVDDRGFACAQTVDVRDFVNRDDFVISMCSMASPGYELVLAKIPPAATLLETWQAVQSRIQNKKATSQSSENKLKSVDKLQIPILDVNFSAEYLDLARILSSQSEAAGRAVIDLHEFGHVRIDGCGPEPLPDMPPPPPNESEYRPRIESTPREFVLDQPFLLAVREWRSDVPFFISWISNAELMKPVNVQDATAK